MSALIASSVAGYTAAATTNAVHQQTVQACSDFIAQYNSANASAPSMQYYAQCVEMLYPAAVDPYQIYMLKFAIIVLFAGAIYGFFKLKYYDLSDRLVNAIIGVAFAFLGLFLTWAVCMGLYALWSL